MKVSFRHPNISLLIRDNTNFRTSERTNACTYFRNSNDSASTFDFPQLSLCRSYLLYRRTTCSPIVSSIIESQRKTTTFRSTSLHLSYLHIKYQKHHTFRLSDFILLHLKAIISPCASAAGQIAMDENQKQDPRRPVYEYCP